MSLGLNLGIGLSPQKGGLSFPSHERIWVQAHEFLCHLAGPKPARPRKKDTKQEKHSFCQTGHSFPKIPKDLNCSTAGSQGSFSRQRLAHTDSGASQPREKSSQVIWVRELDSMVERCHDLSRPSAVGILTGISGKYPGELPTLLPLDLGLILASCFRSHNIGHKPLVKVLALLLGSKPFAWSGATCKTVGMQR